MTEFTRPVQLSMLDMMRYQLTAPVVYHVGVYPSAIVITVPAGTITDLATVPRVLWSLIQPDGKYAKAAILHDYLYQTGLVARTYADELFLQCMQVLGVPFWQRYLLFWAVRLFGGSHYCQKKQGV